MRKRLMVLISAILFALAGCSGNPRSTGDGKVLLVAAAASLEPVVKHLAWTYQAEHPGVKINITSGSSGTLLRQAEEGAGFDLYLPAGEQEMQELIAKQLAAEETVTTFLGNKLVIVVPEGKRIVKDLSQLTESEYKHIGIAEPSTVPAGRYAKQVLDKANLWQQLQPKLVFGNNVRSALTYVATENAEAAFVYRSDALSEDKVHIGMEIDPSLHDPIRYPMAVLKNSKHPELARDFLKFIESPAAKDRFRQAGFLVGQ